MGLRAVTMVDLIPQSFPFQTFFFFSLLISRSPAFRQVALCPPCKATSCK